MVKKTREMKQVGKVFDQFIKKPFSKEAYLANDDVAKNVTCRLFKQFDIQLSEFMPQGSPFEIDLVGQFKGRTIYVECAKTQNKDWNGFEFPERWNGIHVPARKEAKLNADKWPSQYNVKQKDIYYSLVNRHLSFVAVCFDTSAILNSPKTNMIKTPVDQPDHITPDSFYIVPIKHWKIKENPQPNIQASTHDF